MRICALDTHGLLRFRGVVVADLAVDLQANEQRIGSKFVSAAMSSRYTHTSASTAEPVLIARKGTPPHSKAAMGA